MNLGSIFWFCSLSFQSRALSHFWLLRPHGKAQEITFFSLYPLIMSLKQVPNWSVTLMIFLQRIETSLRSLRQTKLNLLRIGKNTIASRSVSFWYALSFFCGNSSIFFSSVGPRDIISIVEGAGFEASIFKRDLQGAGDYLSQREEIKKWRNSFFVSCQCFRFWLFLLFGHF